MRTLSFASLMTGVLVTVLAAACGDSGAGGSAGEGASGAVGTGANAGEAGSGASSSSFANPDIVSVVIDPPTATIVVENGVIPGPTPFKLIGTTSTGSEVELVAAWSFDRPDVATSTASGDLTATGFVGGKGKLRGQFENMSATAELTVKLVFVEDPLAIDVNIKDAFDNASVDDASLSLLYPYDQTVFPRGLAGPVVQWNGGGAADIYEIHAESETFAYTTWATAAPPSRFSLPNAPSDIWKLMTNSTEGNVALSIQRYDGAQAYLAKTQTWKIAPANLAGTIYYWEINQGNVVRLKPGATAPEQFLQKPPGVTCVACHSVSANGSTLVAGFHGGYSPWGTFNTLDGASIYATDTASGFEAISPTGSHVLYGQSTGSNTLTLSTSTDLATIAQLTPPVGQPAHPTWSTDGAKVAYGVRTNGNWLDFTAASLYSADIDTAVPSITNQVELVPSSADAAYPVNTYPSYSPDSKWIAFQRSNTARTRAALGEVWITNADGSVRLPLTKMNGTGLLPGVEGQATYQPTFLPVAVGGYFWLVAESERTYGNTLTDTNPNTRRKQLWVSAISTDPQQGTDPSNPGFWLPGQELGNQNMRGAWALDPCKPLGESCEAGFECCEGFCVFDPEVNDYVCGAQEGCSPSGSACDTAEDCCDTGAQCINGFCAGVAQ